MRTKGPSTTTRQHQPAVRLDAALRARGERPTRQRRAIFAVLSARIDHPTVEALHRAVLRRVPAMSLATVYTALEVLIDAGLATKVIGPDGVAHYDARTDPHDHRRCLLCGRIDDLERHGPPDAIPLQPTADFRPTGYRIEVTGYCSGCNGAAGAHSEPGPSRPRPIHQGEKR